MIWTTIILAIFGIFYILISSLLKNRIKNLKQFETVNKLLLAAWISHIVSLIIVDMLQHQFPWAFSAVRILISLFSYVSLTMLAISIFMAVLSFLKEPKELNGN